MKRRRSIRGLALLGVWALLVAAAPLPLVPPPPELTRLVAFTQAPLDKPRVDVPGVPLPAAPSVLPAFPAAPIMWPVTARPVAFITPPRGYPCVSAWLPIASQALDCGKERFLKGEFADAVKAFESAIQRGADREFIQQSRYWLGESLAWQGEFEKADWTLRQVGGGGLVRTEWEVWAAHASGWTALSLRDPTRARDTFARLLAGAVPSSIQGWARHGLALAHYALGEYAEADRAWTGLGRRGVPAALAREFMFWAGEAAGRVGAHGRAESELRRFTSSGPHPLLDTALVRLGWWTLEGGRAAESLTPFKQYLAGPRRPAPNAELDWAEAGLSLALAATGDWDAARNAARDLIARRSALAQPVALRLVTSALAERKAAEAEALVQELLAGDLSPALRAWLLIAKGDAQRLERNRDEARTQYELAQKAEPASGLGQLALLRLARVNFELREFAQAATEATTLLSTVLAPETRITGLLLQGEAAYHAGRYAVADGAYLRALVEFPKHPQTPLVRLSLAWVALRQDKPEEARRLFLEFARLIPDHPHAADALVLASELAIDAGELDTARAELDRIIAGHPMHPRTEFARLNRAILMVRQGDFAQALPALRDWIRRAPFPPLLGRAHAALGTALLAANKPAEAAKHFTAAKREGSGAVASLGLGAAALAQGRPEEAARALTDARDNGTADIAATAEYGLAVAAFAKGRVREFKAPALAALHAAPTSPMAPRLLYVLTGIAVEDKDWSAALDHARALATKFSDDEAADDALERIGSAASEARAWPVVHDAYSLLRQRYPGSPFVPAARVLLAQALLETGRPDDARRELEQLTASSPPADARPWMLLARARETTGDRRGAVEAYSRAAKEGKGAELMRDALLGQARLLVAEKRWDQARAVLDRLLKSPEQDLVLEAAFSIGETYRAEGDAIAATEYYMTAAYLAPDSTFGQRALLAAAQTFAAANHTGAAATVYKKLLAQAGVPSDLAAAARQGLQALER
ncbi:MAG: tetratricopeptide repeat protein [Candidatus Rokubacteria bacterium]|nr:tetratricopeptide repeat protein [Candidatus Rokubacteria bacterium]